MSIDEAHRLGHGPGTHDELWDRSFHAAAVPVYRSCLPDDYLVDLAADFRRTAELMAASEAPLAAIDSWQRISDYLRGCATALHAVVPVSTSDPQTLAQFGPGTPTTMRFDELAKLASKRGATDLAVHASTLSTALAATRNQGISDAERKWLLGIMRGDRLLDIAESSSLSERSLHRRLNELWERLGVNNSHEAIALCTRNGWLDDLGSR